MLTVIKNVFLIKRKKKSGNDTLPNRKEDSSLRNANFSSIGGELLTMGIKRPVPF